VYDKSKYKIKLEEFITAANNKYRIIKLTPTLNLNNYYLYLLIFVVLLFSITFILASIVVQKQNNSNIINPINDLKKQTNNIRKGELDTAVSSGGYTEIKELGNAIEQLRLNLKNSIYYREKIDDNRKFLISSISHDLKTPVTSIRGYIEGVLEGVANTEEKRCEYLKKAVTKTNLINTMIEDLLLYSKLDLKQMHFEMENTDISKYIENLVQDNSDSFNKENKKIIFSNKLIKDTFIQIDSDKLKRVIQNIIDNAQKNIKPGNGELNVKLRQTGSSVIIEFEDNGKGIKKEDLPFIFDRFYRADEARTVEGSSGLGLAIAKQIVEGLGGRIWALSKDGDGASIIISLRKQA
jgi:signal transduction histidine kinase